VTPDDLAAIRARDAASLACDGPHTDPAHLDRRALLAEVDRLTVALKNLHAAKGGALDERARIRAAVEGLTQYPGLAFNDPSMRGVFVLRAAVLAAIDGEAT
jgi:hypothetical protein